MSEFILLNEKIIKEIEKQDYETITKRIETFLLEHVQSSSSKGLILGLSGGIDSAVLAYLSHRIIKENTLALIMPDTKVSPKSETEDALKIIDSLGMEYKLIDIAPIVYEFSKYLEPNDFALGNLRARIRMNILYYYANIRKYLVLGSGDKSEYLIGYFTKYGDGGADIFPIISLYKLQVREIARYLGVPKNIIEKKSSPHLWKDHLAETEIGIPYEEIDSILYCLIDKKMGVEEIQKNTQIPIEKIKKIQEMYQTSIHKREQPPHFG